MVLFTYFVLTIVLIFAIITTGLGTGKKKRGSEKSLKCCKCGKCFNSPTKLAAHKCKEKIICLVCGKCFKKTRELQIHNRNGVPHPCTHCKNIYCNRNDLEQHQRSITPIIPPSSISSTSLNLYKCRNCFKKFGSISKLVAHDCKTKVIKCRNCGETFKNTRELQLHTRSALPSPFNNCRKIFFNLDALEHYNTVLTPTHSVVSGDNPFPPPSDRQLEPNQCSNCLKKFNRAAKLAKHQCVKKIV